MVIRIVLGGFEFKVLVVFINDKLNKVVIRLHDRQVNAARQGLVAGKNKMTFFAFSGDGNGILDVLLVAVIVSEVELILFIP